jgi:DNA polymerase/3'-5' exonuclease PolX
MSKEKILKTLLDISKRYKNQDNNIKSYIYYKAYLSYKNNKKEGIGPKIQKIIDDIKNNKEVEYPKDLENVIDIPGFSYKKIKELRKMGLDTIEKIKREYLNGKLKLNKQQIIGLKYYKELEKRIPRKSIRKLEKKLKKSGKIFKIMGSYKRGKKTSGDIDILIWGNTTIDSILSEIDILDTISRGDLKYMGIIKVDNIIAHLDIIKVSKEDLIPAELFFTGPGYFNILMRNIAKDKGYKLSRYGLFNRITGEKIKLKSEKDIFKKLGMEYIPYEKR